MGELTGRRGGRETGGDVANERRVKEKRERRKVVFKPRCTIF